jgi:predicted transcriptional regulator
MADPRGEGLVMGAGALLRGAGIQMYSSFMADTTIKISDEVRDRLRILAEERGISVRVLVERLADQTATEAERAEATARGLAYVRAHLCPDLTDEDVRSAQQWRADIAAGRVGSRR